jgi:3-oxoacyl-[acyl-carrier protein] reductase
MRLKDRVAIITGGAQGIGKATTLKFVEEGAKVAIWDINAEKGEAFAKVLQNEGHTVRFFQVNTVDAQAVEATAKAVYDAFGQIDILINNAGITRDATLQKTTPEQWQQVLDVNLTGVFNCTQSVYP